VVPAPAPRDARKQVSLRLANASPTARLRLDHRTTGSRGPSRHFLCASGCTCRRRPRDVHGSPTPGDSRTDGRGPPSPHAYSLTRLTDRRTVLPVGRVRHRSASLDDPTSRQSSARRQADPCAPIATPGGAGRGPPPACTSAYASAGTLSIGSQLIRAGRERSGGRSVARRDSARVTATNEEPEPTPSPSQSSLLTCWMKSMRIKAWPRQRGSCLTRRTGGDSDSAAGTGRSAGAPSGAALLDIDPRQEL